MDWDDATGIVAGLLAMRIAWTQMIRPRLGRRRHPRTHDEIIGRYDHVRTAVEAWREDKVNVAEFEAMVDAGIRQNIAEGHHEADAIWTAVTLRNLDVSWTSRWSPSSVTLRPSSV